MGEEYDVVNVLDEVHNPGLREAIKEYSEWPTIPQALYFLSFEPMPCCSIGSNLCICMQVFVKGEFVGGADILQTMHESGELKKQLE